MRKVRVVKGACENGHEGQLRLHGNGRVVCLACHTEKDVWCALAFQMYLADQPDAGYTDFAYTYLTDVISAMSAPRPALRKFLSQGKYLPKDCILPHGKLLTTTASLVLFAIKVCDTERVAFEFRNRHKIRKLVMFPIVEGLPSGFAQFGIPKLIFSRPE